jgi:hypothetical protein
MWNIHQLNSGGFPMKRNVLIVLTIIFFLGMVAGIIGAFSLYSEKNEMKDEITDLNSEIDSKTSDLEEAQASEKQALDDLETAEGEIETLEASLESLQTDYEDLYDFTYCGEEVIPLENIVYRSNAKVSDSLEAWVDEMWGDVLGADWLNFWVEGMAVMHVIETGYTNDYFIVYYNNPEFDNTTGVFLVSHQCWLDGGPKP